MKNIDYNSKYLNPASLIAQRYKRILIKQGFTVFTMRGAHGFYFRIQRAGGAE